MLEIITGPFSRAFDSAHEWLFTTLVQPAVFGLGWGNLLEDAHEATAWFLVGLLQIAFMLLVIRSMERWRPVEAVVDRSAVRDDIVYTLVHRLGLFRIALFFLITPWVDEGVSALRSLGWQPWQLEDAVPWLAERPWALFLAYLVVFDFVDYWIHRGQHRIDVWWQLHALHHSQRQMTMWSDNRNHLLDDLVRDLILVLVAQAIGVPPAQFLAIVAVTQLAESLSHANLRADFGPVVGRLFVSPAFHRHHHAIGVGHESYGPGTLGGKNFAVLFPVWDLMFGTAAFKTQFEPTGVRDQLPEHGGRDYGQGFWRQQWLGIQRLMGRA